MRTGVSPAALASFEHRLARTYRHRARWARRHDIGAFRCYDRDIPEFPLAIDCYVPEGSPVPRLHVQEIERGWTQSETEHAAWIAAAHGAISTATGVPNSNIVHKVRARRSGGAQHEKTGRRAAPFVVAEAGLRFWINLDEYLDTGLFLDHRRLRAMVRSRAAGKRVLNLFGYTGSFTVYAAAGSPLETVTVDLSNTYLSWAARNLALNGIAPARHAFVRADALRWLVQARHERRVFDLIVCDPPAFSHSKSMSNVFDVQRDHRALLEDCLALLAPGGDLYFSTNLRTFVLDESIGRIAQCEDITAHTRADDFRDPRVHCAYSIRRR